MSVPERLSVDQVFKLILQLDTRNGNCLFDHINLPSKFPCIKCQNIKKCLADQVCKSIL